MNREADRTHRAGRRRHLVDDRQRSEITGRALGCRVLTGFCAALLLAGPAVGGATNAAAVIAVSNAVGGAATKLVPPMPPAPKPPVTLFRELLAMTPAEQRQALASRPAEIRQRILAKLREYQALPATERELRLRATELRWYLQPLMSEPVANREARLAAVPEEMRKLVEAHLTQWDLLPPPLQKKLLEDDRMLNLYLQLEASTPAQQEAILTPLPPKLRQQVEAGFAEWKGISAAERKAMLDRVNQFFDLTTSERRKVLSMLSVAEQRQMEETLRAFEKLPRMQRLQCIRSFGKFASFTPEERAQFLKNAERWKAMTPEERASWRNLVRDVPIFPPLPPGPAAPVPPLPAGIRTTAATN